jgi:hypothetical protein
LAQEPFLLVARAGVAWRRAAPVRRCSHGVARTVRPRGRNRIGHRNSSLDGRKNDDIDDDDARYALDLMILSSGTCDFNARRVRDEVS